MNEAYLKQIAENPEMTATLKEFFLSQKTRLLSEIDSRKMTNENLGQLHRGIDEGSLMVERAFVELRKYDVRFVASNVPMPGR